MSGVGCGGWFCFGVLEGGRKKSRLFRLLVDGGADAGDGIGIGAVVDASDEKRDREKR